MGIVLGSNFDVQTALPLDSRSSVANVTARDAIPSLVRWAGMQVYVVADTKTYQLKGGITNSDWVEAGGGGGGAGYIAVGPFNNVTQGTNTNFAGLNMGTLSGTYATEFFDLVAKIKRGTTVLSRQEMTAAKINGTWVLVLGLGREAGVDHGITFTINSSTGQINGAVDNGAGNADFSFQLIPFLN